MLVVFLIVILGIFWILIIVLRQILTRNITSATQHLDELAKDYLAKQAEVEKKLKEAETIYEEKIRRAQEEVERIKAEAKKAVEEERKRIIQEAREKSQQLIQQGEKARENLILDLHRRIDIEATQKASIILEKVLPQNLRLLIHNHLVEELLAKTKKQLNSLQLPSSNEGVKVISAFSFNDEQRKSLLDNLKEKLGIDSFKEEEDSSLIAGFLITVGSTVLDGSLKWLIKEEAKKLIQQEHEGE